jgi:antitoxin PrlF
MATFLEVDAALTDRYQTTVPEPVRRVLNLRKRDRVRYEITADGRVELTRATPAEVRDPVIGSFLAFLAADMANHPSRLLQPDAALVASLQELVGSRDVDLDEALPEDDD